MASAGGQSLRCRVRGQALIETLVIGIAMVPMFLAVPLLAKYSDIRQAAIEASRTAAFDCTVRFDDCTSPEGQAAALLSAERHHFADPRSVSTSAALAARSPARPNRFWVDRKQAPLLDVRDSVQLVMTRETADSITGALGNGGNGIVAAASALSGPGAFGLDPDGGLIKARVAARVSIGKTLAQWMRRPEGLALRLNGTTAVLTDAWNATAADDGDRRSVRARVDEGWRLPLGESIVDLAYAPIRELITGPMLAPVEPRGRLFRYHEVDVDLVPADRIGEAK